MKILVIDYMSYSNHCNFNKIHIESLFNLGHKLYFVGKKGHFDNVKGRGSIVCEIPEWVYRKYPYPPLSVRLKDIMALRWVNKHIRQDNYDIIIFPTYDIMSIWAYKTDKPVLLINHNNVFQLDSYIKLKITRNLPKNFRHICLNKQMEDRLRQILKNRDISYVPHGILSYYSELSEPKYMANSNNFIFCPINRNYDESFVRSLLHSPAFYDYLLNNELMLFIKRGLPYDGGCENIIVLDNNIKKSEYNYMIQNAKAVLLPYSEEFKYRCSGIFFECVSSNTPIVSSDIPAFRIYEGLTNLLFFTDVTSLIADLNSINEQKLKQNDTEAFMPDSYWRKLLESISIVPLK